MSKFFSGLHALMIVLGFCIVFFSSICVGSALMITVMLLYLICWIVTWNIMMSEDEGNIPALKAELMGGVGWIYGWHVFMSSCICPLNVIGFVLSFVKCANLDITLEERKMYMLEVCKTIVNANTIFYIGLLVVFAILIIRGLRKK